MIMNFSVQVEDTSHYASKMFVTIDTVSIDNLSDHLAISLQLDWNIESVNKVTHEFLASLRWEQVEDVYLSNEVLPDD